MRWKLLKKNSNNPFIGEYALAMDENLALEHDLASWYQSLIRIIRWVVKIGIVDIITEVLMMASQMAMPKEVHLEAILHMFAFLRQNYNLSMAFDQTYPFIDMNDFKECKWKYFYGGLKEDIPPNIPAERRK